MPLLRKHGEEKVRRVGLEVLGYPPTWITDFTEIQKLLRKIK
jgi:hypothetical protein